MTKTFNPFKTVGSYLGVLAGYLFTIKGINAFGFLLYYLNLSSDTLLGGNLIGGFLIGYTAHVFLRAIINIQRPKTEKVKDISKNGF